VLAIENRCSPIAEIPVGAGNEKFTVPPSSGGYAPRMAHIGVADIVLTADPLGAVVAANSRPEGVQAWVEDTHRWLLEEDFLESDPDRALLLPRADSDVSASAELEIAESIKGEAGSRKFSVDFAAATATPEEREKAADALAVFRKAGANPIFIALGGEAGEQDSVLLHVESLWMRLSARSTSMLAFQAFDSRMNGTFNGGTDMLLNTMRFLRDLPDLPVMPTGSGMTWTPHDRIAAADGKAMVIVAVDANADGRPDLLVASPRGDKLLLNEAPGKWTECHGLAGPCVAGDLDGDGLADVLQIGERNGTFWRGRPQGAFEIVPNCGALMGKVRERRAQAADLDGDGLTDVLLIGGGATPLLLHNRGGGHFEETMRLNGEPGYIVQAGAGCAALGDFNNDMFIDLFAGYEAVRFSLQGRCLASRLADRWRGPAVMAVTVPGRYTVTWRTPDGQEHARTVDTERARTEIVLE
jgi:hypothetical protein